LPKEAEQPKVNRGGGGRPIFFLSVRSSKLSRAALTHFAYTHIKGHFQGIDGIAEVKVWGIPYVMSIELDPLAMHNQKVSPHQIVEVLKKNELLLQAGQTLSSEPISLDVVAKNAEDYKHMIVGNNGDAMVYLGDVANVILSEDDREEKIRIDGQNAVLIALTKASDGNILQVTDAIRAALPGVNRDIAGTAEVHIESDKSIFVRESLKTIYQTIGEACVLVLLIIFLFLRHLRATLIPLVTIPISLAATFLALKIFGLSINTITLLAMVLAVGLVVDDAIVVLENIFRYREQGLDARAAAKKGAEEIGFAIIAMTCTLMSVFLPLVFVSDITGILLREFAITLASAVFFSGIVALTLSPLMCAHLLKHEPKENALGRKIEHAILWFEHSYVRLLKKVFLRRRIMYAALIVVISAGAFLYQRLESDLVPKEDRGLIGASIPDIPGFDDDDMEPYVAQAEKIFMAKPEVDKILTLVFRRMTQIVAILKPWDERKIHAEKLVSDIRDEAAELPFDIHPWSDNIGLDALQDDSHQDSSVAVALKSAKSYQEIEAIATALSQKISEDGLLKDAHSDLNMNQKSLAIDIKREALAALGIEEKVVSMTVQTYSDRMQPSEFKLDAQRYRVYLRSTTRTDDLNAIYVGTKKGEQVPLSTVAEVRNEVQAPVLNHLSQMRAATVLANLGDKTSLSDARAYLDQLIPKMVPSDVSVVYEGALGMQEKSSQTFFLLFLAGLVFIFAIMAIQFEGVVDPLIILFTVPFACIGGALMLWIMGSGTNLYTQVGMLTLIGLITKHGILLTEFVVSKRREGAELEAAIFEAASLRFRPIVMTTAAMVLGALPLVISTGAGVESRAAIGTVIVGGMIFGTTLTLFVLPSAIFSVHSLRDRFFAKKSTRLS
jgi:multidrug efflux pump